MATVSVTLERPNYSEEDHWTWSALWKRQLPLAQQYACDLFLEGLERLDLDQTRLPDPQEISDRIFKMTGWTLGGESSSSQGFIHSKRPAVMETR